MRRAPLLLAALCLGLWLPTCGLWEFRERDESRYVEVAREWLAAGGGASFTLRGEPYGEKGPLGLWAIAGCGAVVGPGALEFAARLPSVLAGTALVLLTWSLGRRLAGDRAGLFSALALLTSPLVLGLAPTAHLDMPFAAWIALAAWAWLGREGEGPVRWPRWALLWGAAAAAVLTKGPLGLLVVLCVPVGEAFAARSRRTFFHSRPLLGTAAVLGVSAAWLAAVAAEDGWGFVERMLWRATAERVAGEVHARPFWYYPPEVLFLFAPGSLALAAAARTHLRERASVPPRVGALWVWFGAPLFVLSAVSGKRAIYLLPLLPPAAILAGAWLDRRCPPGVPLPRASRALGAGLALGGAALLAAGTVLSRDPALAASVRLPVAPGLAGASFVLGTVLAAGGIWVALLPRPGEHLVSAVAAAALGGALLDYAVLLPADGLRENTRAFAAAVDGLFLESGGPRELGAAGAAGSLAIHGYADYRVRRLLGAANPFADPSSAPGGVLFVEGDSPRLRRAAEEAGFVPAWSGDAGGQRLVLLAHRGLGRDEAEVLRIVSRDAGTLRLEEAAADLRLPAEAVPRIHQIYRREGEEELRAAFEEEDLDGIRRRIRDAAADPGRTERLRAAVLRRLAGALPRIRRAREAKEASLRELLGPEACRRLNAMAVDETVSDEFDALVCGFPEFAGIRGGGGPK